MKHSCVDLQTPDQAFYWRFTYINNSFSYLRQLGADFTRRINNRPSLALKYKLFVPFWEHLPMWPPYFLLTQSWTLFILICTQSQFIFLDIVNDSMVHVILKNKCFVIIFHQNIICSVSKTTLLFSWHHFHLPINSWFISCFFLVRFCFTCT